MQQQNNNWYGMAVNTWPDGLAVVRTAGWRITEQMLAARSALHETVAASGSPEKKQADKPTPKSVPPSLDYRVEQVHGQCGMLTGFNFQLRGFLDEANQIASHTDPAAAIPRAWDAFCTGYRRRFGNRPMLITDRIDENYNLTDNAEYSIPYCTREFMQYLVDRGETVVILPPTWNVGYNCHVIQGLIWYPNGYITEIKDEKVTGMDARLDEQMRKNFPNSAKDRKQVNVTPIVRAE